MRKPQGKIKNKKLASRMRRKLSIRSKISGSTEKPRLCIVKSNKHLRALVVDDTTSKIIFSMQTYGKNAVAEKGNKDGAEKLGLAVAGKMKELNFSTTVFDRSGNKYTGVVAIFADSVRSNGIKF